MRAVRLAGLLQVSWPPQHLFQAPELSHTRGERTTSVYLTQDLAFRHSFMKIPSKWLLNSTCRGLSRSCVVWSLSDCVGGPSRDQARLWRPSWTAPPGLGRSQAWTWTLDPSIWPQYEDKYRESSTVWGRQRYIRPIPAHTRTIINRRWWSLSIFPSLSLDDITTIVTIQDTAMMLRTTLTTVLITSLLMTDRPFVKINCMMTSINLSFVEDNQSICTSCLKWWDCCCWWHHCWSL